jgi:hypothetical protein
MKIDFGTGIVKVSGVKTAKTFLRVLKSFSRHPVVSCTGVLRCGPKGF